MRNPGSTLSPLSHRLFLTLWLASLAGNFGNAIQSVGAAWLMTALDGHRAHLADNGRLAVARHRQSEGWVREALRERFGTRGLARLSALGLDTALPAGAQPFERLHDLTAALETPR